MTFACETPRDGVAARYALRLQEQLPTLHTERLILRAPRVTDFDTYATIACSPRGAHLGWPMSREAAWADFARMTSTWLLHGHCIWTIGHSGAIAGFVLLGFEPGDMEPELGVVVTAGAEGKGIATEAATATLAHAFDTLGWDTVVSYIDMGNTRAQATARRLGAVRDGIQDEAGVWRFDRGGRLA